MRKTLTSSDSPLRIDSVTVPGTGGRIGMTICPGTKNLALDGFWDRDLAMDLDEITWWGASALVTLIKTRELTVLQVPHLPGMALKFGLAWHYLPIGETDLPDDLFDELWRESGGRLREILAAGGRIVIHCRDGLGRTGLVAARLLVESGMEPEEAIRLVRINRPGAFETPSHEAYVLRLDRMVSGSSVIHDTT